MKNYTDRYNKISERIKTTDNNNMWVDNATTSDNSGITLTTDSSKTNWCYQPYDNWQSPYYIQRPSLTTTITPQENYYIMKKVAVFNVERDKKSNKVTSAELIDEMWIPSDVDASLYVAKKLTNDGKEFDEKTTVVKEILSVSL